MDNMFYNCSSLTSLDLSNFDISKVSSINYLFYNSIKLEHINLINFDELNLIFYDNLFYNIPENLVICIKENITKEKIFPQIINPKENDPLNVGEYFNCYNQPEEGYYFEKYLFKKCYHSCKKCIMEGNNLK